MKARKRIKLSAQTIQLLTLSVLAIGLLGFKLGTLTPGFANSEIIVGSVRTGTAALVDNPLEAPGQALRLLLTPVTPETQGFVRLSSALLGFVAVFLSYWLLKKWYGQRLAFFGTILLITAPWFLHVSRLATNDILYPLSMTLIMLLAALWHQKQWRPRLLYGSAVTLAAISYIPGMLLLVLPVIFFERKRITTALKGMQKHAITTAALYVALVTPLIYAVTRNTALLKQLVGFKPESWPSPVTYIVDYIQSWQYIFIGGLQDPVRNLATLPITNAFISLAFVVGLMLYAKHPKATRTKQLAGLWLIGTALVALGGAVSFTVVLPIVLVLATGGIGYLLHMWLKTFPRNPYARAFGIGLIGLVVAFAVIYNIRNYFVAWPNTPNVKASFQKIQL